MILACMVDHPKNTPKGDMQETNPDSKNHKFGNLRTMSCRMGTDIQVPAEYEGSPRKGESQKFTKEQPEDDT